MRSGQREQGSGKRGHAAVGSSAPGRSRRCRLVALLVFPASLFPLPAARIASRDSVFVATVADATTNQPVTDAEVVVTDLSRSARTNWIGEATIPNIAVGTHHVRVRRLGFAEAELDVAFDRDTIGVFFSLSPRPQSLPAVKSTATESHNLLMHDFEVRRRMGIGRFLTDSMLQADSTRPLTTIIEQHFLGLHAIAQGRTVARRLAYHDCALDIYVDGVRITQAAYAFGKKFDDTDLRAIAGGDVAGVEYYTDLSAPVQYRHQTMACGVLLIWLRY